MLHQERGFHAKLGSLLDGERLVLEVIDGTGRGEVDGDVGTAFDFEGEGFDDTFARVAGVGDGSAAAEAERGFPAVEGFVVCV